LDLEALGHQAQRLAKGLMALQALSALNLLLVAVAVARRVLLPTQTQMADRVAAVVEAEGRTLQFQAVALRHQAVKAMMAGLAAAALTSAAAAAAEQVVLAAIGRP
jgi:hypothetical protein